MFAVYFFQLVEHKPHAQSIHWYTKTAISQWYDILNGVFLLALCVGVAGFYSILQAIQAMDIIPNDS